jgi:hypothetical protein
VLTTQLEGPVLALPMRSEFIFVSDLNMHRVHGVENPGLAVLYENCYGFSEYS